MAATPPPPPSEARQRFARNLRELRLPRGFRTARKFAAVLGIDENRYTRYERAEVEPDLSLLVRICDALGVTPNELLAQSVPKARTPGFADSVAQAPLVPPDVAPQPRAKPKATSTIAQSELVAWQLAEEAVRLRVLAGDRSTVMPVQRLALTGETYSALIANPLATLGALSGELAGRNIGAEEQARFAILAERLVSAVRSEQALSV